MCTSWSHLNFEMSHNCFLLTVIMRFRKPHIVAWSMLSLDPNMGMHRWHAWSWQDLPARKEWTLPSGH